MTSSPEVSTGDMPTGDMPTADMPVANTLLTVKCDSSKETSVSMGIFIVILFIVILVLLVLIFRNQPQSTSGRTEFGVELTKKESSRLQDLKSEQVEIKF